LEVSKTATMRRCYFDFADMMKLNDDGYFPYTPPTQLFHGLKAALARLEAEGLENVFARHYRLAEGVRRAVAAWDGCRLCAAEPKWHSDTVSAIMVPEEIDARDVLRIGYEKYRASFGSGLSKVMGKVFRIGHLAVAVAEMALADAGAKIKLGSGVAAAQAWYRTSGASALRVAAE
jgi:alanine-glyoxylate transaminase/serine-glyoxylate transaminase/serine-pyruvate transaminase